MTHATGTFEVKLTPQATDDPGLGRMTIDKQFHGDLEGTSKGQMLSAGTDVKGSAGYVAIERVTGTLGGRSGTFVLQHSGTMTRGTPQLTITVVPDSGTGALAGLEGKMTIQIASGKHSYEFEYSLPVESFQAAKAAGYPWLDDEQLGTKIPGGLLSGREGSECLREIGEDSPLDESPPRPRWGRLTSASTCRQDSSPGPPASP